MWFHKKRAEPAGMPQLPHFLGAPQQAEQQTPQYTQTFEQPKQVQVPQIQVPKIEQPLIAAAEIPKREPMFLQKRAYPERESQAAEQPRPLRSFEEVDEHGLPKRIAQGFATKEQGFNAMPEPIVQRTVQPEPQIIQQRQESQPAGERRQVNEEKPVFVRLEQYREVIANMDVLKQKIKETEYFIDRIEELRAQEQVELENCHNNLNKLKEKLLSIDKKLFEV